MVEVVVAAVIFALTAAGFYATISALTAPAELSTKAVTAAFLGKQKLEELRTAVNADDWEESDPTKYTLVKNHKYDTLPPINIDGIDYTIEYTVSDDDPATGGREVSLTVTW